MSINKSKLKSDAIVLAGGIGSRMKNSIPKQFLMLNKKPVLIHTLDIFESCVFIKEVTLVCTRDYIYYCEELVQKFGLKKIKKIIPGGSQRQYSVYNALEHIDSDLVCIHDGVRPLVDQGVIHRTILECESNNGCICGVRSDNTVKLCTDGNSRFINKTLPRENIFLAHTPQTFKTSILKHAYEMALKENFLGTDDSSILEHYGYKVKMIESNSDNIKITTPEDLLLAEAYLSLKNRLK